MARTIPAAITNAINSPGAQPSIALTTTDFQLRLASLTTTGFPTARTHSLLTGAGTLLRAAVTQGADPNSLTIYRLPAFTDAGHWTAAGAILSSQATASAGCALVQTAGIIRCFFIDYSVNSLSYFDSTNDGISFGAEQRVQNGAPAGTLACTGITAASTTDLFSTWYLYSQAASGLYQHIYNNGWGPPASVGPGSPNWGSIRGIAVDSSGPIMTFIAGVQTRSQQSGIAAASATYNAGVWSPWQTIHPMDTDSNGLSNAYPTIQFNPADRYLYAGINLQNDGTISGTVQNRLSIWRSLDGLAWQLLQSLGNVLTLEGHILFSGGQLFVFDNENVFQAPAPIAATDLSTDVLSILIHEKTDDPATFTFLLANQNSQYNSIPNLIDNARLQLSIGYNTTTVVTHFAYIDALEFQALPEAQLLTIHCRDILKFLDQISTQLTTFTTQTVSSIATSILRLANVPLAALPTTSQFSQTVPAFTITAGETYLAALKRLSAIYDFEFFATQAPSGSPTLKIVERGAADASSWSYGQEHLGLAWQRSSDQPNVIRVVGASKTATNIFAEAADNADLLSSGVHRYRHIVDRMCTTAAQCQLKANLALRDDQTQSQTGAITVTINPQLELMDVIQITEPRAALSAQNARIDELQTHIDWQHGAWFQHLTLELP